MKVFVKRRPPSLNPPPPFHNVRPRVACLKSWGGEGERGGDAASLSWPFGPREDALLKYGYSNFSLEILEYCESNNRHERENHYFRLLKPEYNIIHDVTPFSDETILKMSEKHPRSQKIYVTDLDTNIKTAYNSIRHAASAIDANRASVVNYLNSSQLKLYLGRYIFERVELDDKATHTLNIPLKIEASLAKTITNLASPPSLHAPRPPPPIKDGGGGGGGAWCDGGEKHPPLLLPPPPPRGGGGCKGGGGGGWGGTLKQIFL
nr:hypothetical protein [Morchella crassipes]